MLPATCTSSSPAWAYTTTRESGPSNVPTADPLMVTVNPPVLPAGVTTIVSAEVVPPTTSIDCPGCSGSGCTAATDTATVSEAVPTPPSSSVTVNVTV
jgi:hypothetical protein